MMAVDGTADTSVFAEDNGPRPNSTRRNFNNVVICCSPVLVYVQASHPYVPTGPTMFSYFVSFKIVLVSVLDFIRE